MEQERITSNQLGWMTRSISSRAQHDNYASARVAIAVAMATMRAPSTHSLHNLEAVAQKIILTQNSTSVVSLG